ncbi:MAG: ABC transporter permease [Mariprofundaceae bacterium]
MNQVRAIVWKEWRQALDTPLAWVVATAFLLASGFFFGKNLFLIGQAEMRGWFAVLPLLLLFFAPAMSMRMLADERRDGTFELLATLPVPMTGIVLGKYLAVLTQMLALLALTLVYPLSLALLGPVDAGQIAASYLAAALLVAVDAAVCLYASALSRHAIVAYVIGFGLLLAVFLIGQAAPTLPPAAQGAVELVSPVSHYQAMLRGVIGLDDLALMAGAVVLFVALTWFALERGRWR